MLSGPLLLLLFSSSLLNTKPSPVYADVFAGSEGPFRFLVDTGSQTTLMDPQLAERLGLQPEFRVEIVTQNTSRLLPGLRVKTLMAGGKRLGDVEVVLQDLAQVRAVAPGIHGVLGMNALEGSDFSLMPAAGKLELEAPPTAGVAVPYYRVEDRIAVKARMGAEELTLILDSGATHVVLFRKPAAMAKVRPVETTYGTVEGARSAVPACWTADMKLAPGVTLGMLPAAIVTRPGTVVDGLLPVSAFSRVSVDRKHGTVILVR